MPTPEKRLRFIAWLALYASLLACVVAFGANATTFIVFHGNIKDNKNAACDTRTSIKSYLNKEKETRRAQAKNSTKTADAQDKFIADTSSLIKLFRKSPNQKSLTPIIIYLQDQVDVQTISSINSKLNIQLSRDAATYFEFLSNSLTC